MPGKKTGKVHGLLPSRGKAVLPFPHHVGGRTVALVSLRARLAGGKWRKMNAYLDSGAHTSVITAATLKWLGGGSVTGARVTLRDTSGRKIACNLVPIEVGVGKFHIPLTVAVSRQYRQRFNILGIDFFEHFRITFDVAQRHVILARAISRTKERVSTLKN